MVVASPGITLMESPVSSRPKARARWSGVMALIGSPFRLRGIQCQLNRSGL